LRDEAISEDDQLVLLETANTDAFSYEDLGRLQVGRVPKTGGARLRTARTRHQFAASRQPHLCPYCRQILRTKWSLKQHITVRHFGAKAAACNQCEKSYGSEADLRRHVQEVHAEPDRKSRCPECGEEVRASYLRRHIQYRHAARAPASCPLCAKVLKSRENMLKHVRTVHERKENYLLDATVI
jgi:hypothetical protein